MFSFFFFKTWISIEMFSAVQLGNVICLYKLLFCPFTCHYLKRDLTKEKFQGPDPDPIYNGVTELGVWHCESKKLNTLLIFCFYPEIVHMKCSCEAVQVAK